VADGKAGFNGKPAGWRGFPSAELGAAQQASLRYSASPACKLSFHITNTVKNVKLPNILEKIVSVATFTGYDALIGNIQNKHSGNYSSVSLAFRINPFRLFHQA